MKYYIVPRVLYNGMSVRCVLVAVAHLMDSRENYTTRLENLYIICSLISAALEDSVPLNYGDFWCPAVCFRRCILRFPICWTRKLCQDLLHETKSPLK